MRAGEPVNGFWVELFSPAAAEVMAAAGYDCAMIDLEHGAADLSDAVAVMRAMLGSGCTPLVRIPENDAAWAKRVLDARSEEHTSELQSLMRISYAVFCLKKKKNKQAQKQSTEA